MPRTMNHCTDLPRNLETTAISKVKGEEEEKFERTALEMLFYIKAQRDWKRTLMRKFIHINGVRNISFVDACFKKQEGRQA